MSLARFISHGQHADGLSPGSSLPAPKTGAFGANKQPTRSIEELAETLAFARKNEDGREGDRRLANRCLQPLDQDRLQIGADARTPVISVSRMSPRRGENHEDSGGRQRTKRSYVTACD